MSMLNFDSSGKFIGVNHSLVGYRQAKKEEASLKTSNDLRFLKSEAKMENIFDKEYWSLYQKDSALQPLKFSNGKTQEDIVEEIVSLIKKGKKVIFLHGVCGTGK